jgi:hypothetical protein
MGFLDLFDDPNVLQYLLGGAPMGGAPGNVPLPPPGAPGGAPPAPPPQIGAPGQIGPAPGQTFTGTPQQNYQLAAQQGFPTDTQTEWNPPRATVPDTIAATGPAPGGGAQAMPVPGGGAGGLPPRATVPDILSGPQPQIANGTPQQRPIEAQPGGVPPMPPPAAPGALPPTATQGGNLMRAFGLNPAQIRAANPLPTVSPWQNALAGLGTGLSTVGGNTGGGAFARGMGGAITGGLRQNQLQGQDVRQAHNDMFNQSNAAYHAMLSGYARDDAGMVAQARANFLNAGAGMRQMGGKDVFSGSPYAKSLKLEQDLDRQDADAGKKAKQAFDVNSKGTDVDGAIKAYNDTMNNIAATRDQRRIDRAKKLGIDPNGYLAGSDQEHAFDYDKMTPEQRLRMPESIYKWKDKDGNTQYNTRDYDAKPPYAGWQRQQQQQQPQPVAQTNEALYGGSGEGDYSTPMQVG